MEEFLRSYGVWIVLLGVFFLMHWFGGGCGARNRLPKRDAQEPKTQADEQSQGTATAGHRGGGCH